MMRLSPNRRLDTAPPFLTGSLGSLETTHVP